MCLIVFVGQFFLFQFPRLAPWFELDDHPNVGHLARDDLETVIAES